MLFMGIIYYYVVSIILTSKVDKDLVIEENEVFQHVAANHNLPEVYKSDDQAISFSLTNGTRVNRRFIDTTFWNGKEDESGRALISAVKVNTRNYRVTIIESKVETEDLIRIIFGITIAVILLLVLSLFIINRFIIRRLWNPFYFILTKLKNFNISDKGPTFFPPSDTDEFNELGNAISSMACKAKNDYQELKAFTENASHELLTPIAVINTKLDTLLQTGQFDEPQGRILSDLYESVSRLTRLNKSMLLLVKIENNLVKDDTDINLKIAVETVLGQLHELYADKSITVTRNLAQKHLYISRSLTEILLNNILINAIRHNYAGGNIDVLLTETELVIKNTGKEQPLNPGQIFERFNKSSHSEGTGLGLTIAKQICENYDLPLIYRYETPYHVMTIKF